MGTFIFKNAVFRPPQQRPGDQYRDHKHKLRILAIQDLQNDTEII